MALSQVSFRKLKSRISQWEATTGRTATPSIIRGFAEAELNIAAERTAQAKGLELQEEQLDFSKKLATRAEAQRLEEFEFGKTESAKQFELQTQQARDAASAAKTSGITQLAGLGIQLAQTDTAKAIGSFASEQLGFGTGSTVAQNIGTGTTQAIGDVGVTAGSPILTSTTGTTAGLSSASEQAISGQFGAPVGGSEAAGSATTTGATTGATASSVSQVLSTSAATAAIGSQLATAVSGDKNADVAGSILGGFAYGGVVGGIVGGIYAGFQRGEIESMANDVQAEFNRAAEKDKELLNKMEQGARKTSRKFISKTKSFARRVTKSLGSVICCELCDQGMLDIKLVKLGSQYRKDNFSKFAYAGYLRWAMPTVEVMRKSKLLTCLLYPVGAGWAKEASHRLYPEKYKGCWYGKIMLKLIPWVSVRVEKRFRKNLKKRGCK